MAYRLRRKDRSIEKAVRRIAREQIGKALNAIEDCENPAEPVHDIRKHCKKLRGLLRLVRGDFEDYAQENAAFRDIAAHLAAPRTTRVTLTIFDRLRDDMNGTAKGKALADYRGFLAEAIIPDTPADTPAAALDECRALLEDAAQRARKWHLDDDGWSAIRGGLARSYTRGFDRFARLSADVSDGPSASALHDARKDLKDHWYHTRLLENLDPAKMRARARIAHRLTEAMGDHHDLSDFESALNAAGDPRHEELREILLVLARRDRAILEERMRELGAKLLTPAPDALVKDWHGLWKRWRGGRG